MTDELQQLTYTARKLRLTNELLEELDYTQEIADDELYARIDDKVVESAGTLQLSLAERKKLRMDIFCALRKLDVLEELLQDETVTEIMINGADRIFVERGGGLEAWDGRFDSTEKLENIIQQIVAKCNRVVNEASPIVDARLEDGSRVNVVLAPIALNGPIVTIRRFPAKPLTMDKLVSFGALPREVADYLGDLVRAGYNIIISGGTGSGKTTFLNALSNAIPKDERVITIEDSAELQIQGITNLVRLETRNGNNEGCSAVRMQDLIKSALRMRPDRIIVGEIRGGEAFDLLQAMGTGHDGSISTLHANTARDALGRLEMMTLMSGLDFPVSAIRRQIASSVDIVIQLSRMRDHSRKVVEIAELDGYDGEEIRMNPLYSFDYETNQFIRKGTLHHADKLVAKGLAEAMERAVSDSGA